MKLGPPHTAELKHRIEIVQRYGARYVKGDYHQRSSVTEILLHLKWDTLESRRLLFQLKYVHRMLTNQVALKPFNCFPMVPCRTTRNSNSRKIRLNFGRVEAVIFSFFFSIIRTWKSLPDNIVSQSNSESFYSLCQGCQGWAINFHQGPHEKPELCLRATDILPL